MHTRCLIPWIAFAAVTGTGAMAESTSEQLIEQDTGEIVSREPASDNLQDGGLEEFAQILKPYAYIDRHFTLMDNFGVEQELARSLTELQRDPETISDLITLYEALSAAASDETGYFGEARWRTLYLLGELRSKEAAGLFTDIAMQPMPSGKRMSEVGYKAEYRLRARAIAGLEQLGDTDALKRLYDRGGMMAGLAAASLLELGAAPEKVVALDGREVFGLGDPTDHNPPRGEVADKLPDGMQAAPKSGADDDVPALTPRFQIER